MTKKLSLHALVAHVVLRILILLLVPVLFIGRLSSGHFIFSNHLFELNIDSILQIYLTSPDVSASLVFLALPAILFNFRLLRTSSRDSVRKATTITIVATLLLDAAKMTILSTILVSRRLPPFYLMGSTVPWILTILVFLPLLFRQVSILDAQRKSSIEEGLDQSRLPSRDILLGLILAVMVVFASPLLILSDWFLGPLYPLFQGETSLITSVGAMYLGLGDELAPFDFVFRPFRFPMDYMSFFSLSLGYVFAIQLIRYSRGITSRKITVLVGIVSWLIPYIVFSILFSLVSESAFIPYPFPILLLIGGLILRFKKPLKSPEDKSTDEMAPEIKISGSYLIMSKFRRLRMKLRREVNLSEEDNGS